MSSTWRCAARLHPARAKSRIDFSRLFCAGVEREVEFQDIHPCLAQKTEIRTVGILSDQSAQLVDVHSAGLRHARNLQLGILHADVRIETAARRGYAVRRDGLILVQSIFRAIGSDSILNCVI